MLQEKLALAVYTYTSDVRSFMELNNWISCDTAQTLSLLQKLWDKTMGMSSYTMHNYFPLKILCWTLVDEFQSFYKLETIEIKQNFKH